MAKTVRAAGGVVCRGGGYALLEIVLVHRPAYDDWAYPKGKLQTGEEEAEAAIREVEEETGLHCRLGREIGTTSYRDAQGRPKTVRYWEMSVHSGELAPANEIDDARWVSLDEAETLLSYERDRRLLATLRERL
jgi:8-oxo-dGTP pyrophosphatase MutT (NUDIX family)